MRMGMSHGAYCVGCCAMLMLLLFAVGVMSLVWVAVIAAFVLVEKLLPAARITARACGAALIALAAATLLL
jgi:predicted metal-binding membrane protein